MQKEAFSIGRIPALVWGGSAEKVIVAVHGSMSGKADTPVEILAQEAVPRGYQVLSFDLPGHGGRTDGAVCSVQNCVAELRTVWRFARRRWPHVGLFANSMGAYFSLLACRGTAPERALFLSPVVDMRHIIENMMSWYGVSPERLAAERVIDLPSGPPLDWDYYRYVCRHPVGEWAAPTSILCGDGDSLCPRADLLAFISRFRCRLEIVPEAEHYFHTPEQLGVFRAWLGDQL